MRKSGIFVISAAMSLVCFYGGRSAKDIISASAASTTEKTVYVGGMSAGFTLKTGAAQVIGTCEVITENGFCAPAARAGVRAGDNIHKVGGIIVETIKELNEVINESKGKRLDFEIERGENTVHLEIQPVMDNNTGRYKIGVLVRDTVSGIGTVTYIDKNSGRFGSLGHSVTAEHNREMSVSKGAVYECSIVGVSKGMRGKAGELRGMFLTDKSIGSAEKLCNCGIFGQVSEEFVMDDLMRTVASSDEVQPGSACIYSTVNGIEPKRYEIEIVKVDKRNKENKNYVIKITDEQLIAETGGIVQGMSGSPILQNGKLVGAVTHVFLNDPTRGYGIDIDVMLRE